VVNYQQKKKVSPHISLPVVSVHSALHLVLVGEKDENRVYAKVVAARESRLPPPHEKWRRLAVRAEVDVFSLFWNERRRDLERNELILATRTMHLKKPVSSTCMRSRMP
jgi:hypothetical protein